MDKITITHFNSNKTDAADKLAVNQWMLVACGEPKKTYTVPVTERKIAVRAIAWIETHPDVQHLPGLHYWGALDESFCDDHGIGYIHSGFNQPEYSYLPVPDKGWALLKVRNDEWYLDVPRQQHIKEVEESPEDWGKKMDYVDGLSSKGLGFFIFTGNQGSASDITFYIRDVLNNIALPRKEQRLDKEHRIIGGEIRKSIYQITKGQKRQDIVDLPVDTDDTVEEEPTVTYPCRAVNKSDGKTVVIDLAKIQGEAIFELLDGGKPVTGYSLIWSNDPDPIYNGARSNAIRYSKNLRYQFKGQVDDSWIVREESIT
jgi:hypothetical protein